MSPPSLPPRPAELQAGVSLIVAVLGISMFLLVIIGVSLSLSVNSRQTVTDQGQALTAQYAAENAAVQAQTRLRVAEQMLNQIAVPRGVTARAFYDDMSAMCGSNVSGSFQSYTPNTVSPDSVVYLDRDPSDTRENWQRAGQVMCTFPRGQGLAAAGVLARPTFYKNADAGTEGAAALTPLMGMTPSGAQLETFWREVFAGRRGSTVTQNVAGAQANAVYGMQPVQVVRLGFSWYRLVFDSGEIAAQGSTGGSRRDLRISDNEARYYLDIRQDSFARYALFTDHHYTSPTIEASGGASDDIWFTENTRFSGPVHTNQIFNFTTQVSDGLGAVFGGRVTSAGCARNQLTATGCNAYTRGARFNSRITASSRFRSAAQIDPNPGGTGSVARNERKLLTENGITTDFRQGMDLRADWIQLPQNVNDQRSMAQAIDPFEGTGLSFAGNVDRMELRAVSANNGTLYQQINATVGTVTTRLLVNAQKQTFMCMPSTHTALRPSESFATAASTATGDPACRWVRVTKLVAGGPWVEAAAATPSASIPRFNGVIHVAGDVRWLGGPDRTSQPPLNSPAVVGVHVAPAIASHAQLTITANRDINIYRDLKYQQDPRTNPGATNVLGLFTAGMQSNTSTNRQEGFINLMADTGNAQTVRRLCNAQGESCVTAQTAADQSAGYVQNDSTPNDLSLDATMLASFGTVRVNGHNRSTVGERGQMHLLGGIIQQYYAAFGTFGGTRTVTTTEEYCVRYRGNGTCREWGTRTVTTQVPATNGYGRNFVYDTRFDDGFSPPGFPTQPVWSREVAIQPDADGIPDVPNSFADVGFWRQVGRP